MSNAQSGTRPTCFYSYTVSRIDNIVSRNRGWLSAMYESITWRCRDRATSERLLQTRFIWHRVFKKPTKVETLAISRDLYRRPSDVTFGRVIYSQLLDYNYLFVKGTFKTYHDSRMVMRFSFSATARSRLAICGACRERTTNEILRFVLSFARLGELTVVCRVWSRNTPARKRTMRSKKQADRSSGCDESGRVELDKRNLFLTLSSKVLTYVKANVTAKRIRDFPVPCKYLPRDCTVCREHNWHTMNKCIVRYILREKQK